MIPRIRIRMRIRILNTDFFPFLPLSVFHFLPSIAYPSSLYLFLPSSTFPILPLATSFVNLASLPLPPLPSSSSLYLSHLPSTFPFLPLPSPSSLFLPPLSLTYASSHLPTVNSPFLFLTCIFIFFPSLSFL